MNLDPFCKKLSSFITREGSKYPFRYDYTYKFTCIQFLEEIDNPSYFSSCTHNEFKQIVVDQLTHEFKCALNSIVFGDAAGKDYVESVKNTMNILGEQYAVYEKTPAHQNKENGVILGPFNTKKDAEYARKKYGYTSDNYYVNNYKNE